MCSRNYLCFWLYASVFHEKTKFCLVVYHPQTCLPFNLCKGKEVLQKDEDVPSYLFKDLLIGPLCLKLKTLIEKDPKK